MKIDANENYRTALKPVWCPGCGNFAILKALTNAFENLQIPKHEIAVFSGIGCSSRITGYISTYGFNFLHGRAIPFAIGAKMANPKLTVLVIGGDGDIFSIGAGHLPHAVRNNADITCIMVNNFVYALTKGQTSPTTPLETNGNGNGNHNDTNPPVDPMMDMISFSNSTKASFIAQGIATDIPHLAGLFEQGIQYKGFSFISVLTECANYRKESFATIKSNAVYLDDEYDSSDINAALKLAQSPVFEKPHLGGFFKGK